MQGLLVRIARALNRLLDRAGKVFADRYHARALRTPREVRAALVYVLQNARKHGVALAGIDPCSSGAAFDGWARVTEPVAPPRPIVCAARSWLLRIGWRRWGAIATDEAPPGALA
jgi:hypothetical protein